MASHHNLLDKRVLLGHTAFLHFVNILLQTRTYYPPQRLVFLVKRFDPMIKNLPVYALLMFVSCTFCEGQNKTDVPKNTVKSVTEDVVTSYGPTSITRNILQDRKGNMWITSWDGIFRYDGKSFTNMTRNVSSARFFSVLEDRKGNLWFGTIGSGVYRYDGKTFQNFTTRDGLPNNEIVCMYEDKSGTIWFGANGGASRYDGKYFRNYMVRGGSMHEDRTGIPFPDFTRPPNEVNSIIEDKTGKFWFGTRGKTFVYDGKTFTALTHERRSFYKCQVDHRRQKRQHLAGWQ